MREFWQNWQRPLQVAGVLVGALLLGVAWLAREPRRLVWRENGVFWVAPAAQPTFFPDSSYVVRLGAHEGATLPVYLTGYYAGQAMPLSEDDVREAIADAVKERRGARLEAVAGGTFAMRPVPSVRIELDLWPEGGIRTDVAIACPSPRAASAVGNVPVQVITTSRGGFGARAHLAQHVGRQLEAAAKARCPEGPSLAAAPAATRQSTAPAAAAATKPALPVVDAAVVASYPVDPGAEKAPRIREGQAARADSGRAAALARAVTRGREVTSLVVAPDTLRLAVGDVVDPLRVWRLTATRADGTVALRVTPLFSADDPSVARVAAGGLTAIRAGVTRLTVRILAADGAAALSAGASAVVHVVVTP